MENKIVGMIGIAMRARKTVSGESIIFAIQKKTAKLVIISKQASANTTKKLVNKCQYYNVPFGFFDESLLNSAIGEMNKKALAITDEGMSKKIMQYMKG